MEEHGFLCKDALNKRLQACIKVKDLACCRRLHTQFLFTGVDAFADHFITCFASCGQLFEASLAFQIIKDPPLSSWHTIICAHAKLAHADDALRLFYNMENVHDIKPDQGTFLCTLKACTSNESGLAHVQILHNRVIISGLESDVALGSTFIDVYAKCGSINDACKVFDGLPNRNIVTWGAMISVCAQHKEDHFALDLFEKMQLEGIQPGRVVFLGILKALGHLEALDQGWLIHHQIIENGLQSDQSVGNSLIDMYAKCKSLGDARTVFDAMQHQDVVSWSAMLAGYVENGLSLSALDLFCQGQHKGIKPDKVMFLCILKACISTGSLEKGIIVHKQIQNNGVEADIVIGNALVDMYAKCGGVENARAVFDKMPVRHMTSWGAMISGYAQRGHANFALDLFNEMHHQGIEPNDVVFLGALKACGCIGSVRQGMLVHAHVVQSRLESDLAVGNAMIDMYMKVGSLEEASRLFRKSSKRDIVSWGEMISGYILRGRHEEAGHYLEEMIEEGVKPDDQIFTTLLMACSQSGLLEEGRHVFQLMRHCGGVPNLAHYNCIIDLLSRAGQLDEAEKLLQSIPAGLDAIGCMSLLTSSRTYGHTQLSYGGHAS